MKNIWRLYLIPNLYLVVWLQWFSYGLLSAAICFALWLLSFVTALYYAHHGQMKIWLKGSLLQFVLNISLTLLTMQWNPSSPHGGTWSGMMEIMYADEFIIVLSIFTQLLQLFFVAPLAAGSK